MRVLDTNDNGPVFQSELYVFNIFENRTQINVIGNVVAEDRDKGTLPLPYIHSKSLCYHAHVIIIALGSNAVVSYILLGVSPPGQMAFTVNSSTGVITKDFDLDREAIDEYILTIQVGVLYYAVELTHYVICAGH